MDNSTYFITLNVSSATASELGLPCVAKRNWFMIGFMPFDSLVIIISLGLLVVSMIEREKLQRQNYSLAVVNSALLSNIVYLSLKLWGASANIMAQDSPQVLGITKIVWTVCESGVAAIGFCVVANASSVIYVTIDGTYVASRAGRKYNKSRLPAKKRISNLLIAISWIVPITFIAVSTLAWNCSAECRCPSSSYEGEVCPHHFRCSRLQTPLSLNFLLVNAALWAFELIALVVMIATKYWEFRNSPRPDRSSSAISSSEADSKRDSIVLEGPDYLTDHTTDSQPSKRRKLRNQTHLYPRFRMALMLTFILSVCFVTQGVAIVIDAVNPEASLRIPMMLAMVSLFLYTAAFPFILIAYIPSLKNATESFLRKVAKCCR